MVEVHPVNLDFMVTFHQSTYKGQNLLSIFKGIRAVLNINTPYASHQVYVHHYAHIITL